MFAKLNLLQMNLNAALSLDAWHSPKRLLWTKALAILVSISFLLPYVSFAFQTGTYPPDLVGEFGYTTLKANGTTIKINPEWGRVTSSYQGTSGRTIIFIQDLHCNYEVQSNIRSILAQLMKKNHLRLVGIEGESTPVNVSKLSTIPINSIKEKVGQYFLQRGRITGPEYQAAISSEPLVLQGIESEKLYTANRDSLLQFLNEESQGYCEDLRYALERLKQPLYNMELAKMDHQREAYDEESITLEKYCDFLLLQANRVGIEITPYKVMRLYALEHRLPVNVAVDYEKLLHEAEALDQAIRRKLYTSHEQRQLDHYLYLLKIMENLVNITATEDDLEYFRRHREEFKITNMLHFLEDISYRFAIHPDLDPGIMKMDEYLEKAAEFYVVADKRSHAFVENILRAMKRQKQNIAVLITGGFHASHVEKALQRQDISFITVKPRITRTDIANPYFSLLRNEKTPLERLLAQNENIFAPRSLFNNALFKRYMETVWEIELGRKLTLEDGLRGEALQQAFREARGKYAADDPKINLVFQKENSNPKNNVYTFQFANEPNWLVVVRPNATTNYSTEIQGEVLYGNNFQFQFIPRSDFADAKKRALILGTEQPARVGLFAVSGMVAKLADVTNPLTRAVGALAIFISNPGKLQTTLARILARVSKTSKFISNGWRNWEDNIVARNPVVMSWIAAVSFSLLAGSILIGAMPVLPLTFTALFVWSIGFLMQNKHFQALANNVLLSRNDIIPRAIQWAWEEYGFGGNEIVGTSFEIVLENVLELAKGNPVLAEFIGQRPDRLALAGMAYNTGMKPWTAGTPTENVEALARDFVEAEELAQSIIAGKALDELVIKGNSHLAQLIQAIRAGRRTFEMGEQEALNPERMLPEYISQVQRDAMKKLAEDYKVKITIPQFTFNPVTEFRPQFRFTFPTPIKAKILPKKAELPEKKMELPPKINLISSRKKGDKPALIGPASASMAIQEELQGIMDRATPLQQVKDLQVREAVASGLQQLGFKLREDGRVVLQVATMIKRVKAIRRQIEKEEKALRKRSRFLTRRKNLTPEQQKELANIKSTLEQYPDAVFELEEIMDSFKESGDRVFEIRLSDEMQVLKHGDAFSVVSGDKICFNARSIRHLASKRNRLRLMKRIAHESGHIAGLEQTRIGEARAGLIGKILSGYQLGIAEVTAEMVNVNRRAILGEKAPLALAAVGPAEEVTLSEEQRVTMQQWFSTRGWTQVQMDLFTIYDQPISEHELQAMVPRKSKSDEIYQAGVSLLHQISQSLAEATGNLYSGADVLEVFRHIVRGKTIAAAIKQFNAERQEYIQKIVPEQFEAYEAAKGAIQSINDVRDMVSATFTGEEIAITPALRIFADRLIMREQEAMANDENYTVELYLNFDKKAAERFAALPAALRSKATETLRAELDKAMSEKSGLMGILIAKKLQSKLRTQSDVIAALRDFDRFMRNHFSEGIFTGRQDQIRAAVRKVGQHLLRQAAAQHVVGVYSNKAPPSLEELQSFLPRDSNAEFLYKKITSDNRFTDLFPNYTTQLLVALAAQIKTLGYRSAIANLQTASQTAENKVNDIQTVLNEGLKTIALVFDEISWKDLSRYLFHYYIDYYVRKVLIPKYGGSYEQLARPESLVHEIELAAELNVLAKEIARLRSEKGGQALQMTAWMQPEKPAGKGFAMVGPKATDSRHTASNQFHEDLKPPEVFKPETRLTLEKEAELENLLDLGINQFYWDVVFKISVQELEAERRKLVERAALINKELADLLDSFLEIFSSSEEERDIAKVHEAADKLSRQLYKYGYILIAWPEQKHDTVSWDIVRAKITRSRTHWLADSRCEVLFLKPLTVLLHDLNDDPQRNVLKKYTTSGLTRGTKQVIVFETSGLDEEMSEIHEVKHWQNRVEGISRPNDREEMSAILTSMALGTDTIAYFRDIIREWAVDYTTRKNLDFLSHSKVVYDIITGLYNNAIYVLYRNHPEREKIKNAVAKLPETQKKIDAKVYAILHLCEGNPNAFRELVVYYYYQQFARNPIQGSLAYFWKKNYHGNKSFAQIIGEEPLSAEEKKTILANPAEAIVQLFDKIQGTAEDEDPDQLAKAKRYIKQQLQSLSNDTLLKVIDFIVQYSSLRPWAAYILPRLRQIKQLLREEKSMPDTMVQTQMGKETSSTRWAENVSSNIREIIKTILIDNKANLEDYLREIENTEVNIKRIKAAKYIDSGALKHVYRVVIDTNLGEIVLGLRFIRKDEPDFESDNLSMAHKKVFWFRLLAKVSGQPKVARELYIVDKLLENLPPEKYEKITTLFQNEKITGITFGIFIDGKTLDELPEELKIKTYKKNIILLAETWLKVRKGRKGFSIRDLKPQNFVLDTEGNKIYFIDLDMGDFFTRNAFLRNIFDYAGNTAYEDNNYKIFYYLNDRRQKEKIFREIVFGGLLEAFGKQAFLEFMIDYGLTFKRKRRPEFYRNIWRFIREQYDPDLTRMALNYPQFRTGIGFQALSFKNTLATAIVWIGVMAIGLNLSVLPAVGFTLAYQSTKLITILRMLYVKHGFPAILRYLSEPVGAYDPVRQKMVEPQSGKVLGEAPWPVVAHEVYSHKLADRAMRAVGINLSTMKPGTAVYATVNAVTEFIAHTLDFFTAPLAMSRIEKKGPRVGAVFLSGIFIISGLLLAVSFFVALPFAPPVVLLAIFALAGLSVSFFQKVHVQQGKGIFTELPAIGAEVRTLLTGLWNIVLNKIKGVSGASYDAQAGKMAVPQILTQPAKNLDGLLLELLEDQTYGPAIQEFYQSNDIARNMLEQTLELSEADLARVKELITLFKQNPKHEYVRQVTELLLRKNQPRLIAEAIRIMNHYALRFAVSKVIEGMPEDVRRQVVENNKIKVSFFFAGSMTRLGEFSLNSDIDFFLISGDEVSPEAVAKLKNGVDVYLNTLGYLSDVTNNESYSLEGLKKWRSKFKYIRKSKFLGARLLLGTEQVLADVRSLQAWIMQDVKYGFDLTRLARLQMQMEQQSISAITLEEAIRLFYNLMIMADTLYQRQFTSIDEVMNQFVRQGLLAEVDAQSLLAEYQYFIGIRISGIPTKTLVDDLEFKRHVEATKTTIAKLSGEILPLLQRKIVAALYRFRLETKLEAPPLALQQELQNQKSLDELWRTFNRDIQAGVTQLSEPQYMHYQEILENSFSVEDLDILFCWISEAIATRTGSFQVVRRDTLVNVPAEVVVSEIKRSQVVGVYPQPEVRGLNRILLNLRESKLGQVLSRFRGLPTGLKLMMLLPDFRLQGFSKILVFGALTAAWTGISIALAGPFSVEIALAGVMLGIASFAPAQYFHYRLNTAVASRVGQQIVKSNWMKELINNLDKNWTDAKVLLTVRGLLLVLEGIQEDVEAREGVLEILSQMPQVRQKSVLLRSRDGQEITQKLPSIIFERPSLARRLLQVFPRVIINGKPFKIPQLRQRRVLDSAA